MYILKIENKLIQFTLFYIKFNSKLEQLNIELEQMFEIFEDSLYKISKERKIFNKVNEFLI